MSTQNRKFGKPYARSYEFRNSEGTGRPVIEILFGGKRAGFIEYNRARSFVDRIHDLCDQHEKQHGGADNE